MRKLRIAGVLLFCCCAFTANAQKKQVRIGNKLYEQKKYKQATAEYQQALQKNPGYVPGLFNLGNALYQQNNLDQARQVLSATARQAKDKEVKADANYNIGNTYMKQQKWEEAVNSYKAALKNNPHDEAAKYNLSYALAMMKKNQGGGGKNDKQNKDQNKDQQKQDKDQSNDNKDQNKDQKNKQDQNKDQQNKDQQNQNQDKQDQKEQQNQHPQPQPSKLSKDQADQLLNALAQEEKKLHDKKEKGKAVRVKVDKDW
jgi:tetratricopeptide (TPR) repeat protein